MYDLADARYVGSAIGGTLAGLAALVATDFASPETGLFAAVGLATYVLLGAMPAGWRMVRLRDAGPLSRWSGIFVVAVAFVMGVTALMLHYWPDLGQTFVIATTSFYASSLCYGWVIKFDRGGAKIPFLHRLSRKKSFPGQDAPYSPSGHGYLAFAGAIAFSAAVGGPAVDLTVARVLAPRFGAWAADLIVAAIVGGVIALDFAGRLKKGYRERQEMRALASR